MDRRAFLKVGAVALTTAGAQPLSRAIAQPRPGTAPGERADYTIRIGTGLIELAPDHIISTTTDNGQFPGPLLRFKEGQRVVIDIHNDTDTAEQLHWHGQTVPVDVDGAAEEGTPYIPAHGMRHIAFTPGPAGFRFYHTHVPGGSNLQQGQYSGQVGPVYIEPKREAGAYDREVFLVLKEFEPFFSRGGDMDQVFLTPAARLKVLEEIGEDAMRASLAHGAPHGYEVGYQVFSINGCMPGHGEPIRVKTEERVLLHVLNGSATESRSLALPGHTFRVVALDGNPVHPGVWILGDLADDDRRRGMGIVVEYADRKGKPRWAKPRPFQWDYTRFGIAHTEPAPDEVIEMTFEKRNAAHHGFNEWTINFTAENPGLSLFHCHMQLHMDYGFMALFDCT